MRDISAHTNENVSKVECVEVLVPRDLISNPGNNLFWTLSVYSLENRPVKHKSDAADFEIFHFMVYDWKRTIQQLLEDHKLPYSIVQYFTPASIYPDKREQFIAAPDGGIDFMAALNTLPETGKHGDGFNIHSRVKIDKRADLIAG